jgi:hypothetical protein
MKSTLFPSAVPRRLWWLPSLGLPLTLPKTRPWAATTLIAPLAKPLDDAGPRRHLVPHASRLYVAKPVVRVARLQVAVYELEQTDPLAVFVRRPAPRETGERLEELAGHLPRALGEASAHVV